MDPATTPTGTKAGPTLDATQMCASLCMQLYSCDNSQDIQICRSSCLNELTIFFSKVRPDALTEIDGCLRRKDCATVLKGTEAVFEACSAEAQAARAPSATGTDFCNRWESSATRCGLTGFNKAKCLDGVKLYTDPVITEGIACTDKACPVIDTCIETNFDW